MYSVFIEGLPVPQGSLNTGKHGKIYQSRAVKEWRETVAQGLARVVTEFAPSGTPIEVSLEFSMPHKPTSLPDLDKLVRAVLDAMSGIVYKDDRQVTVISAVKYQRSPHGVDIYITRGDT